LRTALELARRSLRDRGFWTPALVTAAAAFVVAVTSGFYLGVLEAAVGWTRVVPGDVVLTPVENDGGLVRSFGVVPPAVVGAVTRAEGVAGVHELVPLRAWLEHDGRDTWVQLIGISPRERTVLPAHLLAGRRRPRLGEIVVDLLAARDLGVWVGDRVGVRMPNVTGTRLRVVGVSGGGNDVLASFAFVSRATLALAGVAGPTHLFVLASPGAALDAAWTGRVGEGRLRLLSRRQFEERTQSFARQLLRPALVLLNAAVAAAAAATVAIVLHARSVARQREFALLAAVGASGRVVSRMVVLSTVLVTSLGTALGLLAAVTFATLAGWATPRFVSASPWWLIAAIAAGGVAVGLVAALAPVRAAGRVDPGTLARL
jgi:putative ABC transport system permease protein